MNLNKVFILGRLTRDPEQRTTPSGKTVSNFGVATNRVWTDQGSKEKQEQAEFHNVVAFGRLAEICNQYLTKGQLILVEGRIQTRSWTNQDGNKRSRTEIIAENMQMGPRAGRTSSEEVVSETSESTPEIPFEEISDVDAKEEKPKKKNKKEENDEEEIDVKDIPF